jgi:hypothetical protein
MRTNRLKQLLTRTSAVFCGVAILLSLLLVSSLSGQTASTGALQGTVKDSSGAVVPNVMVTAKSTGTGQARSTTTDNEGTYKFGFLPLGAYSLRFEAAGFSAVEVPSITVVVTETTVLDQVLQVGGQAQQVEVKSEAETVQTTNSTLGTVVAGQTLTALPLTSRNYTTLLGLAAGANVGVYNAASMGRGSQDIVVNGSGIAQNNYSMDGASIVNFSTNGKTSDSASTPGIAIVNPDAIQEFKIQTSLYDAGYGRKPGANVNVVTKSGTNQFHGTAFEFFRNTALNANDYFRKISPPIGGVAANGKQVLNQNQYGGTIGGPIKKDKLFFFGAFQETQQRNGIAPAGYSTPTLVGIPQGDRSNTAAFRSALGAAFCPTGTGVAGTTGRTSNGGTQVACNGANINPVAINILQLKNADGSYYVPSSSTGINQNTTFSSPAKFTEPQATGNFDYLINDKNTFSGRYFYSRAKSEASMGCGVTSTTVTLCLPGGPGSLQFTTQYSVGKLTSILSNNVVNEARFSLQRVIAQGDSQVKFTDTQVGITPIIPSVDTLNTITITGLMQFGGSSSTSTNTITSYELADQISWSRGKHTIRAGFEYERDRQNWLLAGIALGNTTYQTFQDFLLGLPGCAPGVSAPACATSATLGQTNGTSTSNVSSTGTSTSITPPGGTLHHYRIAASNAFVQDDIKLSSNLTVNVGLRWEYNGLNSDTQGQNTNVWPSLINTVPIPGSTPATGTLAGFVVPSNYNASLNPAPTVGGLYQSSHKILSQNSPSLKNFAPRAGFAWKPLASDRFVVRGGAGYFYDRIGESTYIKSSAQAYPYQVPVFKAAAANYFSTSAVPYAPSSLGWSPRWTNLTTGASSNLSVILMDPQYLNPVTYEWNLNVQYEFLSKWVLELGYVGTRSIHQAPDGFLSLQLEHQINAAQLASVANPINGVTTNTTGNASLRVPYLGFAPGGLGVDDTRGDSKYNSLQATVRKQLSHGVQFQAAYTFSRGLTTTSFYSFGDPNAPRPYGLNPAYRPHRLTVNYSYELPFGHHEGFLDKIASGWSLAGVTVVQTGTPLTITDTRGGAIYGFGPGATLTSTAQFAPGMSNGNVATSGSVSERLGGATGGLGYFNKAAFGALPTVGATTTGTGGAGWGNSGLGIILGPGQFNFDGTVQKITKVGGLHEDANLVFRAEFFNLFNHAQFANPTGAQLDFSKTTFGQITSTAVNPRLIQFALKYVF